MRRVSVLFASACCQLLSISSEPSSPDGRHGPVVVLGLNANAPHGDWWRGCVGLLAIPVRSAVAQSRRTCQRQGHETRGLDPSGSSLHPSPSTHTPRVPRSVL